jgi:hypothetical protein
VFSKPLIRVLLNEFVGVKLYIDSVPREFQPTTSADENRDLLTDKFGTAQLPLYVILKPLGGGGRYEEIARYDEGKINDVDGFAQFLRAHSTRRIAAEKLPMSRDVSVAAR